MTNEEKLATKVKKLERLVRTLEVQRDAMRDALQAKNEFIKEMERVSSTEPSERVVFLGIKNDAGVNWYVMRMPEGFGQWIGANV